MVHYCIVPGCESVQSGSVPFFKFPSNHLRQHEWLEALRIPRTCGSIGTKREICLLHFEKTDIVRLGDGYSHVPDAVPSIHPKVPLTIDEISASTSSISAPIPSCSFINPDSGSQVEQFSIRDELRKKSCRRKRLKLLENYDNLPGCTVTKSYITAFIWLTKRPRNDLPMLHPTFPTFQTFLNSLSHYPVVSGICDNLLRILSVVILTMFKAEQYCAITFGEIEITPRIHYSNANGIIEGYTDLESVGRSPEVADRLLVFIIRGLCSRWDVPIATYFRDDATTAFEITLLLTEIVTALLGIGFVPVVTVSDQSARNVSAVHILTEDNREPHLVYEIKGNKMFHIYDYLHLLTNLRNKFLDLDIVTEDGVATWTHIPPVYEADSLNGQYRLAYKLSSRHVYPEPADRKKVSHAVQVLSSTVATLIHHRIPPNSRPGEISLPVTATATRNFVKLMDTLFDSMNGFSAKSNVPGKPLKAFLTPTSGHLDFWLRTAKKMLKWVFLKQGSEVKVRQPQAVRNWINTLQTLQCLWHHLHHHCHLEYLVLSQLNGDAIQSFFSAVRARTVDGSDPSCELVLPEINRSLIKLIFYRAHILNKESKRNCSKKFEQLLFLYEISCVTDFTPYVNMELITDVDTERYVGCLTYPEYYYANKLAGKLAKVFVSKLKCRICSSLLFVRDQCTDSGEQVPSRSLIDSVHQTITVIDNVLVNHSADKEVTDIIHLFVHKYVSFNWFTCSEHKDKFLASFDKAIVPAKIRRWCNNFNVNLWHNKSE